MMRLTALILCLLSIGAAARAGAEPLQVLYMAQAGYTPQAVEQRTREFSAKTGIDVSLNFVEYESLYPAITEDSSYDVVLLDNIWTADLANRGILEPVPENIRRNIEQNIIPEIYNANSYAGKIWAVPFLANFQLLYTNMTMLKKAGFSHPPKTLEELKHMAAAAKEAGIIEFPVFDSLRAEEVLVCELVWMSGIDGMQWETDDSHFIVDRPELRKAVEYLLELKKEGLLNPYSLDAGETFSAEVFIWNDALFSTNWTFVIGEMERARNQNVKPEPFELGVSLLPYFDQYGKSSTISGFQGLAVMKNSALKDEAWEYIMFLSSPDFQRQHLEEFSVWTQVWFEKETITGDAYFDIKRSQVGGAKSRPVHPRYQEISRIIQTWTHRALMEHISVNEAFSRMQAEINGLGL